jgi:hypothetical protein
MLLGIVLLTVIGFLTLENFFVLSFVLAIITSELTAPNVVTVHWRVRMRRVLLIGVLLFIYVTVRRILILLPPNLL